MPAPVLAQTAGTAEPDPQPAIAFSGRYVLDLMSVADGGDTRGTRVLGNVELMADADLYRLIGWHGARMKIHLLNNHGGRPNDLAGTLQGVDNIEVADARTKLYEAWIEQGFADDRASLLFGLWDLNSEFYQNDAAGLLIAPAFGMGSELSATGPNGPSIFPSTALAARLNVSIAQSGYLRLAVLNARAGVLGDSAGVDFSMHDGVLIIAEGGSMRGGKLALGVWRYSRPQDDLRVLDANGMPARRIAQGVYLLAERHVLGDDKRGVDVFVRAGLSEGRTTAFHGGFQVGLLVHAPLPSRPDGQLSLGVAQGALSDEFRDNLRDAGMRSLPAETGFEVTYSDKITPFLSVQPDLQYIRRAYSDGGSRGALVVGVRLIASFG